MREKAGGDGVRVIVGMRKVHEGFVMFRSRTTRGAKCRNQKPNERTKVSNGADAGLACAQGI
jgi:hypothetical protein